MSFPDMNSLKRAGEMWKFRAPDPDEPEDQYREELADFVVTKDPVESMEIRSGKGWDKWDDNEQRDSLRRAAFQGPPGTLKVVEERK
jgi:hypothetical protein